MDDTSLQFAQPLWIAAGVVACAALLLLFHRFDRRRDADLAKLIHPRFRQRLTDGFSPRLRNLKRGLWLLAVLLAFTAIARPQRGYEWREVKRKGIDILFAVDTSRSMLAEDLTPNRLERARLGILDFVARLEGDRVGLIPFAGSAFALCPLTLDYDAFRESLDALDTELIPRQGTDIASAIKEAGRLFDENGNNHRVLVLLTDGEDLQGDVTDAAKAAAAKGMAIYTIGVGSPAGARIPIRYANGRTDFVRHEDGRIVETKLDETVLKKIAQETGALYVALGRGAEGLETIYREKLRLVPKSEQDQRMERIPVERYEWPLGAAIALLVLEFFIRDRRRVGKMLPPALALLVLGLSVESRAEDARRIYNQGTEAYGKGDFPAATESLKASLRTPDLALQQRSYYNLGNTLYRTGQGTLEKDPAVTIQTWKESIKAYQDALALDAADADAAYNAALVGKKLEELEKQEKEKQKPEDQKKDQEKKDDQEKKEQEKQDKQDKKDEQDKKESGDPKPGEEKKEGEPDKKPGEEKPGEEKPGKEKPGEEKGAEPKDSKKEGEPKPGEKPGEPKPDPAGAEKPTAASEERGGKKEMTPQEARQLLEALRQDERTVIPIPQQQQRGPRAQDNTTKGKTW